MPSAPPPTEAAGDRAVHGPQEANRPARVSAAGSAARALRAVLERSDCRGTGEAVDHEAGVRLEAADGAVGMRSEATVDRPRREAALFQKELEGGDVPAPVSAAHNAAAERRPAAPPERVAGLGAGDTVDRQVVLGLKAADRTDRLRSRDPIDRAPVEVLGLERDLERGDVPAAHGAGGGRRRERQRRDGKRRNDDPAQ